MLYLEIVLFQNKFEGEVIAMKKIIQNKRVRVVILVLVVLFLVLKFFGGKSTIPETGDLIIQIFGDIDAGTRKAIDKEIMVFEEELIYVVSPRKDYDILQNCQVTGKWESTILREAQKHGVYPPVAIGICTLENSGRENAGSWAGCVGIYQLSAYIAERYGLSVSEGNDERLNPARSVYAALRYIRETVAVDFEDPSGKPVWDYTIAAYHMGGNNLVDILKEYREKKGKYARNYWEVYYWRDQSEIYPLLGDYSENYIFRVLASYRAYKLYQTNRQEFMEKREFYTKKYAGVEL